MTNYYHILGVPQTATIKEIEKAYKKLALIHHPDKGGSSERFQEIVKAYEILHDEEMRQEYDSELQDDILHNLMDLRFVPYHPKIIPIMVTLREVLEGCEKKLRAAVPHFFDKEDRPLPARMCVRRCHFCFGMGCSTCAATGRLINDKIFCRIAETEIELEIHKRKGICTGYRIDCNSYILVFTVTDTHPIRLRKHDIYADVEVPVENFLLGKPFMVQLHEPFVFCAKGPNLNNSYTFPGLGLFRNLIARGDLIIYPKLKFSEDFIKKINSLNLQVPEIQEKNILMFSST